MNDLIIPSFQRQINDLVFLLQPFSTLDIRQGLIMITQYIQGHNIWELC
jgi:hypothetical protein